ncbi:CCDC90 family protein [Symbiopectobacterium purcellii]|uniref:CCDC90 family protein n=1 Tax=Symbiopectobacterium purcellii TaxID=2871826 RepID=A0ABX9AMJ0_9ENTR|nr:CCDC90 family protein [Symbiopectobacterium purcellii]QZN96403.1 CCDC90 family protein [Symbiopectobacterium purcellii]
MGQVAFDTLQASEELETAGISREQAKAISLVVRKSHEVADVATKADIAEVNRNVADVRKDLSAEIANVRKDLSAEIANVRKDLSAEIANVRKDLSAEIANVRKDLSAEIADVRKDLSADIALLRKDVEHTANGLLIKLSAVMLAIAGLASTIVTVVIKLL